MTFSASNEARTAARAEYDGLLDETLASWSTVRQMHDWPLLLLGNGASMAVWRDFGYQSLYETACSDHGILTAEDQALFRALKTMNFEGVLRDLMTAETVDSALGLAIDPHHQRYQSIRDALVAAVHAVHIPWSALSADTLVHIRHELTHYDTIFTTNYDLLTYWAIMCEEPPAAVDYFWQKNEHGDPVFNPLNTDVWGKASKILFLHGGLHLLRLADGRTIKRMAGASGNLLDQFGEELPHATDAVPLFVSEGSSADKLAVIRSSNYLSFALTALAESTGPLVVFGHSLSPQDAHLVNVLKDRRTPIAVSLRQAPPQDIIGTKAELQRRLGSTPVLFFDAATHPLGDPSLQAVPEVV